MGFLTALISLTIAFTNAALRFFSSTLELITAPLIAFFRSAWNFLLLLFGNPQVIALYAVLIVVFLAGLFPMYYPTTTMTALDTAYECVIYRGIDYVDSTVGNALRYTVTPFAHMTNAMIRYDKQGFKDMWNGARDGFADDVWAQPPSVSNFTHAIDVMWYFVFQHIPYSPVVAADELVFGGDHRIPMFKQLVRGVYHLPLDLVLDEVTVIKNITMAIIRADIFWRDCHYAHLYSPCKEDPDEWLLRGCLMFNSTPWGKYCWPQPWGDDDPCHVAQNCTGCHDHWRDAVERIATWLVEYIDLVPEFMEWFVDFLRNRKYHMCEVFDLGDGACTAHGGGGILYAGKTCQDLFPDPGKAPQRIRDLTCTDEIGGAHILELHCDQLDGCDDVSTQCAHANGPGYQHGIVFAGENCGAVSGYDSHWTDGGFECETLDPCEFDNWATKAVDWIERVRDELSVWIYSFSDFVVCFIELLKDLVVTIHFIIDAIIGAFLNGPTCQAGGWEIVEHVIRMVVRLVDCFKHLLYPAFRWKPMRPILYAWDEIREALIGMSLSIMKGLIWSRSCFYCKEMRPVAAGCETIDVQDCVDTPHGVLFPLPYTCLQLQFCASLPHTQNCSNVASVGAFMPDSTCSEFTECTLREALNECTIFSNCTLFGSEPWQCEECHNYTGVIIDALAMMAYNMSVEWGQVVGVSNETAHDVGAFWLEVGHVLVCLAERVKALWGSLNMIFDRNCGIGWKEQFHYFVDDVLRALIRCLLHLGHFMLEIRFPAGNYIVEQIVLAFDEAIEGLFNGKLWSGYCEYCAMHDRNSAGWPFEGCWLFTGGPCQAIWDVCDTGPGAAIPCGACTECLTEGGLNPTTCKWCELCGEACDICVGSLQDQWSYDCTSCIDPIGRLGNVLRFIFIDGIEELFFRILDLEGLPLVELLVELVTDFLNGVIGVLEAFARAIFNALTWAILLFNGGCAHFNVGERFVFLFEHVFGKIFVAIYELFRDVFGDLGEIIIWIADNLLPPGVAKFILFPFYIVEDIEQFSICFEGDVFGYGYYPYIFNFDQCVANWEQISNPECDLSGCFRIAWNCLIYEPRNDTHFSGPSGSSGIYKTYEILGFIARDGMRDFLSATISIVDEIWCWVKCVQQLKFCPWHKRFFFFFTCFGNTDFRCSGAPGAEADLWDLVEDFDCFDRCHTCDFETSGGDVDMCYAWCYLSGGSPSEDYHYCTANEWDLQQWCQNPGTIPGDLTTGVLSAVCDAYRDIFANVEIFQGNPFYDARYTECISSAYCGDCDQLGPLAMMRYEACVGACMLSPDEFGSAWQEWLWATAPFGGVCFGSIYPTLDPSGDPWPVDSQGSKSSVQNLMCLYETGAPTYRINRHGVAWALFPVDYGYDEVNGILADGVISGPAGANWWITTAPGFLDCWSYWDIYTDQDVVGDWGPRDAPPQQSGKTKMPTGRKELFQYALQRDREDMGMLHSRHSEPAVFNDFDSSSFVFLNRTNRFVRSGNQDLYAWHATLKLLQLPEDCYCKRVLWKYGPRGPQNCRGARCQLTKTMHSTCSALLRASGVFFHASDGVAVPDIVCPELAQSSVRNVVTVLNNILDMDVEQEMYDAVQNVKRSWKERSVHVERQTDQPLYGPRSPPYNHSFIYNAFETLAEYYRESRLSIIIDSGYDIYQHHPNDDDLWKQWVRLIGEQLHEAFPPSHDYKGPIIYRAYEGISEMKPAQSAVERLYEAAKNRMMDNRYQQQEEPDIPFAEQAVRTTQVRLDDSQQDDERCDRECWRKHIRSLLVDPDRAGETFRRAIRHDRAVWNPDAALALLRERDEPMSLSQEQQARPLEEWLGGLISPFDKTIDSVGNYFDDESFIGVISDLAAFVEDLVHCNGSYDWDGTNIYNVFCLQIPIYPLDPPNWHEVVPMQIPWDPILIQEDCQSTDGPRTWIFDRVDDNCKLPNDTEPRPLCGWCHYCERLYNLSLTGFGDVVDHFLFTINVLEWWLDALLGARVEGVTSTVLKFRFGINCIAIWLLVYLVGSVIFFLSFITQIPAVFPTLYILFNGQIAWGVFMFVIEIFVLFKAGLFAMHMAFWVMWFIFMFLMFLASPFQLNIAIVCWISKPLVWMRNRSMFYWIPGVVYFANRTERVCYGSEHDFPVADIQLWGVGFGKTALAFLIFLLIAQVFLVAIIIALIRLVKWIAIQFSILLRLYQDIRNLRVRLRVEDAEEDIEDLKREMRTVTYDVEATSGQTDWLYDSMRTAGMQVRTEPAFQSGYELRNRKRREQDQSNSLFVMTTITPTSLPSDPLHQHHR